MALSEEKCGNRKTNRQNSQSDLTHQQPVHSHTLALNWRIGFRELLALRGFIGETKDKL